MKRSSNVGIILMMKMMTMLYNFMRGLLKIPTRMAIIIMLTMTMIMMMMQLLWKIWSLNGHKLSTLLRRYRMTSKKKNSLLYKLHRMYMTWNIQMDLNFERTTRCQTGTTPTLSKRSSEKREIWRSTWPPYFHHH